MPDFRRRNCADPPRGCGKNSDEVGDISWSGLCIECGLRRAYAQPLQMHHHSGPFFQEWRHAVAAAVGGVILDVTALPDNTLEETHG